MVVVLDIFCGTKSVKKICDKKGWKYIGLDIDKSFEPDICIDFMDWDYKTEWKNPPDIIWFSPECRCYSMASGNTHFNADHSCKTDAARKSLKILQKIKEMIDYFNCFYIIENPRARMRWFMNDYPRYTVAYCRYGFNRMKPTDIFTNLKGFKPQMCNNGNKDHIAAPRGSKTGTQGIPKKERYKVPPLLIEDLFNLLPIN